MHAFQTTTAKPPTPVASLLARAHRARACAAGVRRAPDLDESLELKAAEPGLRSSGQRLDESTRRDMEARFGHDFSRVRVHTDSAAAHSAHALNARAYTVDRDLVFRTGAYEPGTSAGDRLLAHELAHVVQQSRAGSADAGSAQTEQLEHAANRAADACISGAGRVQVSGASPVGVAREDEKPTFGNLAEEKPNPDVRRSILVKEGETWYERRPNGQKWRATGTYSFVIQKGKVWAVKPTDRMDAAGKGHTEAAAGGRVEYAGMAEFGSSEKQRGILRTWRNASGHYKPVAEFKDVAVKAGFDEKRFEAFKGPREPGQPQAQLPMVQPPPGSTLTPRKPAEKPPATDPAKTPASAPLPAAPKVESEPWYRGEGEPRTPASPPQQEAPKTAAPKVPATPVTPPPPGPVVGSQGQRVYGGAPKYSQPIQPTPSGGATAVQGAAIALGMAMARLDEIGRSMQNQEARAKIAEARREIIDALQKEPDVGAIIEVQFLEPEHRFQDVSWRRTTDANAAKPTRVQNEENRQPVSTFIYVQPMRLSKPGETGPSAAPDAPRQVNTGEEFIRSYLEARGTDLSSAGMVATEMYDALQRGRGAFGWTDVSVGTVTLRVTDAARASVQAAVTTLARNATAKRLEQLKAGIDFQQGRLTEKLKEWFGGEVKLTGHELDRARAHHAAASNYFQDAKYGPALESIKSGEAQVQEVSDTLHEYVHGRRPN